MLVYVPNLLKTAIGNDIHENPEFPMVKNGRSLYLTGVF